MEKQIAYIRNKMIGLIAIIAIVSAWQWDFIHEGVMAHVWTTGSILSAFAFAIIMAFIFVHKLKNEVIAFNALKEMWDDIRMGQVEQKADPLWRHYRCSRPGRIFKRPRLLGHAYDLVTDELARTKKIRISVETMNTLVHKIGGTIDDEKSLLGYMSGLLVFMGLIGTFIGLLHMVGSMGGIIGTLASSAGGAGSTDAFQQLLGALQEPLKGMASGFAASLFGLFSSLVVGLLARFAGQAAGVLKHEFESWLAGVVQIGDEEDQEAHTPQRAVTAETVRVESLVRTVGDILADYAKVAANFDQTVRVLGDIQRGQLHQGKIIDSVAQSMSRIGAGIEALTDGVSKNIATELAATRAMVHELERTHNGNLRMLVNSHAADRRPDRRGGRTERRHRRAHAGATERQHRGADRSGGAGCRWPDGTDRGRSNGKTAAEFFGIQGGHGQASGAAANVGDLENQISEGFERLNHNVGAAFSAYSGVLKMAVAALDKSEPGLDELVPETAAAHAAPIALAH